MPCCAVVCMSAGWGKLRFMAVYQAKVHRAIVSRGCVAASIEGNIRWT